MNMKRTLPKLCMIDAVGAAVCLVITLAFYMLVVQKHIEQRDYTARQETYLQQRLQAAGEATADLRTINDKLRDAKQKLESNEIKLLPVTQLNHRLDQLSALLADCGIKVNHLKAGARQSHDQYIAVPIEILGEGTFMQSTDLMQKMHRQFADSRIESFDLTEPREGSNVLSFRLQLKWHAGLDANRVALMPTGETK